MFINEDVKVNASRFLSFLKYSEKQKKTGKLKEYKDEKYGRNGQDQAGLYTFGMHLFTVIKKK